MKIRTVVVVDIDEAGLVVNLPPEEVFHNAVLNRFQGTAFHIEMIYSTKEEDET